MIVFEAADLRAESAFWAGLSDRTVKAGTGGTTSGSTAPGNVLNAAYDDLALLGRGAYRGGRSAASR